MKYFFVGTLGLILIGFMLSTISTEPTVLDEGELVSPTGDWPRQSYCIAGKWYELREVQPDGSLVLSPLDYRGELYYDDSLTVVMLIDNIISVSADEGVVQADIRYLPRLLQTLGHIDDLIETGGVDDQRTVNMKAMDNDE